MYLVRIVILTEKRILKVALNWSVKISAKKGRKIIKVEVKVGSYQVLKEMTWDRGAWWQRWPNGLHNRKNTI